LYLINNPDLGYDIRVVKSWNAAIRLAKEIGFKIDYPIIETDDTVYPIGVRYSRKIYTWTQTPSSAIASGMYTRNKPVMSPGAGRFIRNSFFEGTTWKGCHLENQGQNFK
jgi:hypothetical protein